MVVYVSRKHMQKSVEVLPREVEPIEKPSPRKLRPQVTRLNGEVARDRSTAFHLAVRYPLYAQLAGRKIEDPKQYADPAAFGEFLEKVDWKTGHVIIRA